MTKKKYLDEQEPTYYGGTLPEVIVEAPRANNNVIHIVDQPKYNQGEIRQAEENNKISNAINQYFRKAKYLLNNNKVLGGEYTIPAVAALAVSPKLATSIWKGLSTPFVRGYLNNGVKGAIVEGAKSSAQDAVAGYLASKIAAPITKTLDSVPASIAEGLVPLNGAALTRSARKTVGNIERRAIETAMRTTPESNPIRSIIEGVNFMKSSDKGRKRLKAIGKYILTGQKTNNKGYYNSFAASPFSPNGADFYGGYSNRKFMHPVFKEEPDYIDAFLYKKDIPLLTKVAQGKDFGIHTDYVRRRYANKQADIPVYEITSRRDMPDYRIYDSDAWISSKRAKLLPEFPGYDGKSEVNVAGHLVQLGKFANNGIPVLAVRGQDIWKFDPKDYYEKWLSKNSTCGAFTDDTPLWEKIIALAGLHEVDRFGTPIITRTNWQNTGFTIDTDNVDIPFKFGGLVRRTLANGGSTHINSSRRSKLIKLKTRNVRN